MCESFTNDMRPAVAQELAREAAIHLVNDPEWEDPEPALFGRCGTSIGSLFPRWAEAACKGLEALVDREKALAHVPLGHDKSLSIIAPDNEYCTLLHWSDVTNLVGRITRDYAQGRAIYPIVPHNKPRQPRS